MEQLSWPFSRQQPAILQSPVIDLPGPPWQPVQDNFSFNIHSLQLFPQKVSIDTLLSCCFI